MYMNRFITGAIVGGAVGVLGATYALTSNNEKKMMAKRGRKLIDMTNHKLRDFM